MHERVRRTILCAQKSVHANIKFVEPWIWCSSYNLGMPTSMPGNSFTLKGNGIPILQANPNPKKTLHWETFNNKAQDHCCYANILYFKTVYFKLFRHVHITGFSVKENSAPNEKYYNERQTTIVTLISCISTGCYF